MQVDKAKLYSDIKEIAGERKIRQKLLEELAEMIEEAGALQRCILKGESDNRHELYKRITRLFSEMVDVLITAEQNLDSHTCDEYFTLVYQIALEKLQIRRDKGELLKGMAS